MVDLLEQLKLYIDPTKVWDGNEEQQLFLLLRFSSDAILNQAYPYGTDLIKVPKRYENLCIRASAELYAKMGAEGQTSHSENGISRTWASATLLPLLQSEIVPMAKTLKTSILEAPLPPSQDQAVTQEQLEKVVDNFNRALAVLNAAIEAVDFAQKHIFISEEFSDAPALLAWVSSPANESKLRHGTELHTDTDEPNFRAVFNIEKGRWEAKESPLANKQWVRQLIDGIETRISALEGRR